MVMFYNCEKKTYFILYKNIKYKNAFRRPVGYDDFLKSVIR